MRFDEVVVEEGSLVLWHTTSAEAARLILLGGFKDGPKASYMFGHELQGVFVANRPLSLHEGTKGVLNPCVLRLNVRATRAELDTYQLAEEGEDFTYLEWCVPAAWLNGRSDVVVVDEDDLPQVRFPFLETTSK